tara:strand:+ start:237 stop:2141 length:1905 start_codon:yes stop_codon:yes gene_type:complete
MANTIRLKRASGSDPGASDLVTGELAIRTDTAKLFTKKDDNSVAEIGGATVADGSITSAKIANDTIVNVDINSSAAIAGTKIAPNFGTQNIVSTGQLQMTAQIPAHLKRDVTGTNSVLVLIGNNTQTFAFEASSSGFSINDYTDVNTARFSIDSSKIVSVLNHDFSAGVDVTGNITVSGTVDGRDVAADGTKLDGIESGATADQSASEIVALIADQTIAPSTIDMEDNEKIKLGAGDDLELVHDGSNSIIKGKTGETRIQCANTFKLTNSDNTETHIKATLNGDVELFFDNARKLETTSDGIDITGSISLSGLVDGRNIENDGTKLDGIESGATADQSASEIVALIADQTIAPSTIDMEDNEKIKLGASDDLEIYHDGSNSFISETGTGDLKILTGTLQLKNAADNKFNILINSAGVVELYHDGSAKFATSSSGVSVTGNIAVSGTVDGRDVATDGSKLDGIASGATNVTNTNQLTNGAGFITSADGGNAATLDGVDSSQFLRSDTADSASGILSLSGGLSFGSNSRCAAGVSALSDGSTITVDFTSGIHHSVTLGGNRTFGNPSNDGNAVGQSGSIFITQDGSGSRTASFHGDYKFAGGTAPTLSTGANAVDRIDYVIKSSGVIHCAFTADIK